MNFLFRHYNRLKMPTKHIVVCEDDLGAQARISAHFAQIFEHQGYIIISYVSGSLAAASIIFYEQVDLIILDHDMPRGNGPDLLAWLKQENKNIPIITFSGIPHNNMTMQLLGVKHIFNKEDVINGCADDVIKSVLGL